MEDVRKRKGRLHGGGMVLKGETYSWERSEQ